MAQEWGTPRSGSAWDRVASPTAVTNPAAQQASSERESILPRAAAAAAGAGADKATPLSHALSLVGIGLEEDGDEEAYFTPEERAALRRWEPSLLPIFGDLTFDRTRSRLLTVLLFLLAGLATFLQLFLPQLSLGPLQLQRISTCTEAVRTLAATPGSGFSAPDQSSSASASLNGTYLAFLVCSLLASVPWNPPICLLLGAATSTAYVLLYTITDMASCFKLAAQPPLLISWLVGGVWVNQVSTTVLFYNFLIWVVALLCMGELYRLSFLMLRAALCGSSVPLAHLFALQGGHAPAPLPSPREPAGVALDAGAPAPAPAPLPAPLPPPTLLSRAQAHATAWCHATYTDVLCAAPLRHCIACLLSTVGLATMASTMSGWGSLALVQLRALRALLVDPSQALPPDTPQFLRQLIGALNSYIPQIWRASVFGTLDSALVWVTVGSWLVCLVFMGTCAASMGIVARHRRELQQRYHHCAGQLAGSKGAGVAGAGAGGAEARAHRGSAKLTPPPDSIYTFVVFDATQYVAAHLVCHLFVFLVFFLYLTVIVIAVGLLYLNGLGSNLSWVALVVANLARSQLYDFLLFKLPPFVQRWVLAPLSRHCGWDEQRPASAFVRRLLGLFCLASRWLDGPHVLHPRVFVLADTILSVFVGPILGVVDAVTRLVLGSVWGLLKISFLYEAVIPLTFASFDRPYMSYGAMQRVSLVEGLDCEVAGVPPRVRDMEWR